MSGDLSGLSLVELFRMEADSQIQVLTAGLLALEREPTAAVQLEACMRAAHSLKGAARIVGLGVAVDVTHVMEDCLVAAQRGLVRLGKPHIDRLLEGVDLLHRIAGADERQAAAWEAERPPEVAAFLAAVGGFLDGPPPPARVAAASEPPPVAASPPPVAAPPEPGAERVLRVTAEHFNRLLGLAGESLVESRGLRPFVAGLLRLKRGHRAAGAALDLVHDQLGSGADPERAAAALLAARGHLAEGARLLAERLDELESFERRAADLARRMHDVALSCRMRPFADATRGFPRMVRDLARDLGKQARLELVGEATPVDRDMLERLETPLAHLLRNAVDHGIEPPEARIAAGKPAEAVVRLEAYQAGGRLRIVVSDDGPGVDLERVRRRVVERGLAGPAVADRLSAAELFEFLFLPGFTLRDRVTEISGRGVGLDTVLDVVRGLRGAVRASSPAGGGARFELELPLTVSVVRCLLVEIGGQPYAFPLAQVARTLAVARAELRTAEGRQHFAHDEQAVSLVAANQVIDGGEPRPPSDPLQVLLLADRDARYGLVVDRFLGTRELVIQPLDPRLGKIKDVVAGAILDDGAPALIVDVDDLVRSVEKLATSGRLATVDAAGAAPGARKKKVLVVDDSLTVRELERKLIAGGGYEVEVAVDGVDGWNAARGGDFDLVVTDVDMPRMDGIDLVRQIRRDARLKALPVMIVSYKDREQDRQRGLEAGADFYLAKSSFHNEALLAAVVDLIGEASR